MIVYSVSLRGALNADKQWDHVTMTIPVPTESGHRKCERGGGGGGGV